MQTNTESLDGRTSQITHIRNILKNLDVHSLQLASSENFFSDLYSWVSDCEVRPNKSYLQSFQTNSSPTNQKVMDGFIKAKDLLKPGSKLDDVVVQSPNDKRKYRLVLSSSSKDDCFFCLELVFSRSMWCVSHVMYVWWCSSSCLSNTPLLISFHDIQGPGSQTWLQYFN